MSDPEPAAKSHRSPEPQEVVIGILAATGLSFVAGWVTPEHHVTNPVWVGLICAICSLCSASAMALWHYVPRTPT